MTNHNPQDAMENFHYKKRLAMLLLGTGLFLTGDKKPGETQDNQVAPTSFGVLKDLPGTLSDIGYKQHLYDKLLQATIPDDALAQPALGDNPHVIDIDAETNITEIAQINQDLDGKASLRFDFKGQKYEVEANDLIEASAAYTGFVDKICPGMTKKFILRNDEDLNISTGMDKNQKLCNVYVNTGALVYFNENNMRSALAHEAGHLHGRLDGNDEFLADSIGGVLTSFQSMAQTIVQMAPAFNNASTADFPPEYRVTKEQAFGFDLSGTGRPGYGSRLQYLAMLELSKNDKVTVPARPATHNFIPGNP